MSALVQVRQDRVVADSRDVAAQFGKRHDHVLRSIDMMTREQPDLAPNFGAEVYPVIGGDGAKRYARRFDMDRKGFMLLVMGFSGRKALVLKARWIDAFDAMERALTERELAPPEEMDPPPLEDIRERLLFVREARILGGRAAGRRAWEAAQLPDVFSGPAPQLLPVGSDIDAGLLTWMAERTEGADGRIESSALYADYLEWCAERDERPRSVAAFGRALSERGVGKMKSHGGRILRLGLRLRTKPQDVEQTVTDGWGSTVCSDGARRCESGSGSWEGRG